MTALAACLLLVRLGAGPTPAPQAPAPPAPEALATGRVIPSLATRADPSQSYALYLPRAYVATRRWPILYCFDPVARGAVPVELFSEAAEAHGFIVVGSNNSRNGPQDVINAALAAIWDDTQARFAIDPQRIYATGFSGGARVASILAMGMRLAGLVGVGAGFSPVIEPKASLPFAFFGIAGRDDFNYSELHELVKRLDAAGVPNHFEVFDGGHQWPPREVAARAIAWMQLQAMRAGRIPMDAQAVASYLTAARERIAAQPAESYERFVLLRSAVADLRGLAEVGEFQAELAALRKAKPVKRGLRSEKNLLERQRREGLRLQALKTAVIDPASVADALAGSGDDLVEVRARLELTQRLGELRSHAAAAEAGEERTLARRLLYGFLVTCREAAREARRSRNYDLALAQWRWVAVGQPDTPAVDVQTAALYALMGDAKKALRHLEQAVGKGLADAEVLAAEPAFDSLRGSPEYRRLVEQLRSRSKP
jgi:dienelactone hydrolase